MIIHPKSSDHVAESVARRNARFGHSRYDLFKSTDHAESCAIQDALDGQSPQVRYDPFRSYTSEELAYLEHYQKECWKRERRAK